MTVISISNARDFGLPFSRPRMFIHGFLIYNAFCNFLQNPPSAPMTRVPLREFLEQDPHMIPPELFIDEGLLMRYKWKVNQPRNNALINIVPPTHAGGGLCMMARYGPRRGHVVYGTYIDHGNGTYRCMTVMECARGVLGSLTLKLPQTQETYHWEGMSISRPQLLVNIRTMVAALTNETKLKPVDVWQLRKAHYDATNYSNMDYTPIVDLRPPKGYYDTQQQGQC
jgi:hypothetical protein